MQGEDFGGGVRVPVDRHNGTGVRPAEQEGVALLGGGVTWARASGRGAQNNNNNNNNNNNTTADQSM